MVLFSSSTNEAETMLNESNEAEKRIGLRINRKKTQFMKKAYCEDGGVQLGGSQIMKTSLHLNLGRSMNMEKDVKEELNRRMRAAWAVFTAVREATDQLTGQDLRAQVFDSTVLPALFYAAETWADTAVTSRKVLTSHRSLERCLLKFNRRTQRLAGLRSSDLRRMSRLRDPAEYISKAKHRLVGHIMKKKSTIDGPKERQGVSQEILSALEEERHRDEVTCSLHALTSRELSWIRLNYLVNVTHET